MPGGDGIRRVVAEFGRGILKDDGAIDRGRLAREVFERPERLAKLNSLVHPPVIRLEEDARALSPPAIPRGIAVVEAAILVETGRHETL